MKKINNVGNNLYQSHKGTAKLSQEQKFYTYLKTHVTTCTVVSEAIGVPQKNNCRNKDRLQKAGLLWVVKIDYCPITGHKAQYLTTDPSKAPKQPRQLNLFEGMGGVE